VQGIAQGIVGRVLDKAFTQNQQSIGHAQAQAIAHASAFLLPGGPPLFPDALGRFASGTANLQ
jgi:hypothetical protein